MYTLKGFYAFTPLVNNTPDQVALFGEISNDSLTFAKDKTFHIDDAAPQTTLISFYSINDQGPTAVPASLAVNALKLGQWLYTRAVSSQMPTNPTTLTQQVMAEFKATLTNFACGKLLTDNKVRMPEWISYNDLTVTGQNCEITIWLSDASFATQYTEYEIEVIPPITPLDDFFKDSLQVKALLDKYNLVTKMNEVQATRGKYPYTQIKAMQYNYQNPKATATKYMTNWIVLIYGQAGNNPDLVRQAIVDYVLANSSHKQDDWVTILPDLFKTTEFVIVPFWANYAVENAQYQGGIYSPTVRPAKALALLKKAVKGSKYTEAWINAQYETSGVLYKSLAFGVVGNPDNKDGLTQFSDKFKDYILVSNNSDDLNRVSVTTGEFIVLLLKLITTAEEFDRYSAVPVGMARVIREGIVYISAYYDNVNYLVAGKPSVELL